MAKSQPHRSNCFELYDTCKHIDYIPAWDREKTESEIADLYMEKSVPERETQPFLYPVPPT